MMVQSVMALRAIPPGSKNNRIQILSEIRRIEPGGGSGNLRKLGPGSLDLTKDDSAQYDRLLFIEGKPFQKTPDVGSLVSRSKIAPREGDVRKKGWKLSIIAELRLHQCRHHDLVDDLCCVVESVQCLAVALGLLIRTGAQRYGPLFPGLARLSVGLLGRLKQRCQMLNLSDEVPCERH
jgi:hypothetical protein